MHAERDQDDHRADQQKSDRQRLHEPTRMS